MHRIWAQGTHKKHLARSLALGTQLLSTRHGEKALGTNEARRESTRHGNKARGTKAQELDILNGFCPQLQIKPCYRNPLFNNYCSCFISLIKAGICCFGPRSFMNSRFDAMKIFRIF